MGKNKKKSKNTAEKPKAAEKKKPAVTMADLQAMSDSEDSGLPPEEEWDADAKALKKAIEAGAFDNAMISYQEEGDAESVEEVALEDGDDDEDDDEELDAEKADDDEAESEDEEKIEKANQEDVSESDEEDSEKEEDEPDSKPKSTSEKPQHKKDSSAEMELSEDSEEEEEEKQQDDDSEEEDDEEEKKKINENMNTKAIRVVTEDLETFRNSMPWAESFVVVPSATSPFAPGVEDPLDIHDDLKREVAFYDLALEAALTARKKCEEAKIPFSRPEDFFAEMVKTDEHMAHIKDRLIFENKKMEAVAQRKSNKEHQLRAKEAQSNKFAEKAKRKKDHFKAVQEWAQTAASQRGGAVNEKADETFLRNMNKGPNKKRQAADRKYGYGGKRGRFKKTDPATLNDMSGFNKRGNFAGGQKRTSSASAGSKRPGKRARTARSKR
eukprot:scaffold370_cov176-Amphora_coffeaeformis.AAC.36